MSGITNQNSSEVNNGKNDNYYNNKNKNSQMNFSKNNRNFNSTEQFDSVNFLGQSFANINLENNSNFYEESTKNGSYLNKPFADSKILEESIISYQTECTKIDCDNFPEETNLFASIHSNNLYMNDHLKHNKQPQKYTEISFKNPLKMKNYPHFENYHDYFENEDDKSMSSETNSNNNNNNLYAASHQEYVYFNNDLKIGKQIPDLENLFKQIPEDFSKKLSLLNERSKTNNLREEYFNFKLKDKNSPFMYAGEKLFDDNASDKFCYDIQFNNNKNYEEMLKKNIDVCLSGCLIYKSKIFIRIIIFILLY